MKRAFLLILLCAGTVLAQQQTQQQTQQQALSPPPAEQRRSFAMAGTFELGGSVSFTSFTRVDDGSTRSASNSLALSPTVGYFVIDGLEIVLDPLSVGYAWSGDINTLTLMPAAGLAYNFRANPRAFPYLEGVAGYAYSRSTIGSTTFSYHGLVWAGKAGVKMLLTGTAIVNVAIQYQQVTLNQSGESERNGYNQLGVTAGLALWL